jgi:hypothetical protein
MDIPKPHPPKKIAETVKDEKPPVVKKPFLPKPHLTSRPFQSSEELRKLQRDFHTPPPKKSTPRKTSTKNKEKN